MSEQDRAADAAEPRGGIREGSGFELVVDVASMPYLAGATIDYVDTLQGAGFVVDNPNAAGSCACGDSFH